MKYPHIGAFHNVVRAARKRHIGKMLYMGTVKLHGTNGRVFVHPDGAVEVGSRNRMLSIGSDNNGFCAWVNHPGRLDYFREKAAYINGGIAEVCFFGEFIGRGINAGCAIHELPERQFVIFDTTIDGRFSPNDLPLGDKTLNIYNINTSSRFITEIDFNNPEASLDYLNAKTNEVEAECPWGKAFDINGIGEGIVWKPTFYPNATDLWFKTKGMKHRTTQAKSIRAVPKNMEAISDFVKYAVTPARLEQGFSFLNENELPIDISSTGAYIKWVCQDIQRECAQELTASGLNWKRVSRSLGTAARNHFMRAIKEYMT